MKNFLLLGKSVPRWIILLLDMLIVIWSFISSYFTVQHFEFSSILRGHFFVYNAVYCIPAIAVMYFMRIHTGLMRYSNTHDVLRIFSSIFLSSVICLFLVKVWVNPVLGIHSVNIYMVLMVNFSISSTLLIMTRTAVRSAFFYLKNYSNTKRTVIVVYGSDSKAVLIKQALENSQSDYQIVGFVDGDLSKVDKEIEQVRVYSISKLSELKEKRNVEKLIITNDNLEDERKKAALDECLALNIQVLTVPPAEQWIYGKLNMQQVKDLKIEDLLQRKPIKIDTTTISEDIKGKRILITGAAGSIGSEIVRQVMEYDPAMVILCDQAESPLHDMQLEVQENYPHVPSVIFIADIRNYQRMKSLFLNYKPEMVFHAAAYKHVPMMEDNPSEAVFTNVLGTKHVADLSIAFGAGKFVMISTDKAVNPTNVMGATKRIAEIYIQSLKNKHAASGEIINTRFITTRFGNVLGSNGSVIPRFRAQIQKGGPITVTHPEIMRYFMTISEAVQLVLEAGVMGSGGEIYIFDMGKPVKIADLAVNMIKLAGLVPEKDIKITFTGLRPGEKLYEELLNQEELTLPTHHEKIKIAKIITYPYEQVAVDIDELIALNKQNNNIALVEKMKMIVPEFVSKNSQFEKLDKKGSSVMTKTAV
jgi:FlaA1/EpsC-like NDP-sugar epimerase